MTGPQQKFCNAYAVDKNGTAAYRAAYPKSSLKAAESGASRMLRRDKVKAEIQRIRDKAQEKAGSAVLTIAEKRMFLARAKRLNLSEFDLSEHGDLVQSIEPGEHGTKYRFVDKLAAIKLDNDLAGEGSEAGANDALQALLGRIRK